MINNLQKLKLLLEKIKTLGYVKSHRAHDTGLGKTIEDLLGIKENNLRLPDIGDIELKAKRIDSASMLTIATKSPEPKGVNKILFNQYKYKDKDGFYNLHSTVSGSRPNQQSFQVVCKDDKLILKNKQNIECYWPVTIFDDVLRAKSDKILLIYAESKGERKTMKEKFHFVEAHLLSRLNIDKFKSAIENDKLKIDIRISVYRTGKNKGKYHDHGTGFRINKKDFLHIFDNFEQII